jgi:tripartite motif-containing protein 71
MKHHLKVFFREQALETKTIGNKGIGVCKFAYPRGIALDHQENILVADSQNHRVQVVTIDGEYIGSFGTIGDDPGSFNTPYDVTVDKNGNIIVADTKNHRVQVFTRLVSVDSMYGYDENEHMNGHSEERKSGEINGCEKEEENQENLNNGEGLEANLDTGVSDGEVDLNKSDKIHAVTSNENSEVKDSSTEGENVRTENGDVKNGEDLGKELPNQTAPTNDETTEQNSSNNNASIGNSDTAEKNKEIKVDVPSALNREEKKENAIAHNKPPQIVTSHD